MQVSSNIEKSSSYMLEHTPAVVKGQLNMPVTPGCQPDLHLAIPIFKTFWAVPIKTNSV